MIQNFGARILTGLRKYDHNSPASKIFGWPSAKDLLIHDDLIMMYKCLNGLDASYLKLS